MTRRSNELRAIAQRVAAAHAALGDTTPMALVSGSVVEDIADARSDVDMSITFDTLHAERELRGACEASSGAPWHWQAGALAEGGLVVAFKLGGVEVQIAYNGSATLTRELDQVLVAHDPDTPLHKLAEGLQKAEPLFGEARLRALQARVDDFPPALGRAMAAHFLGQVTPWRAIGQYFTTFQFKRMQRFAAKLPIAPQAFAQRLEQALHAEVAHGVQTLHALESEVLAFVANRWPDLDLAA